VGRNATTCGKPAAVARAVSASGDICAMPMGTTWMRAARRSPVTSAMSAAGSPSRPSTCARAQRPLTRLYDTRGGAQNHHGSRGPCRPPAVPAVESLWRRNAADSW